VKFLRQLAAVVLTVAVIVGLGMLWAHASGGGTGPGGGLGPPPSRQALQRIEQIKSGAIKLRGGAIGPRSGDGFQLANTQNLIRTCEIEAVLAAVVIAVSTARRRRRRMRRWRASGVP
jgi:hypothetical protein